MQQTAKVQSQFSNDLRMIGLGEFALAMGVCSNTVRNWIATGKLKEGVHYIHLGRKYQFPWGESYLDQFMRSLAAEVPPPRPRLATRRPNRGHLKYKA